MGIFQPVSVTPTFYAQFLHQYFCAKKLPRQNVTREKLQETLSYKKTCTLMKLTTGGKIFLDF